LVRLKDEVRGTRGVTPHDVFNVLKQMPKMGVISIHVGHTLSFGDALLDDDYTNAVERLEFYGTGSWNVAMPHGANAAGCALDAQRTLNREYRTHVLPDGREQYEDSSSTTGPDDYHSKTVSKRWREKKLIHVDAVEHKMRMDDQMKEVASQLMQAANFPGRRLVGEKGEMWWEQVRLLRDPWGFPDINRK
jgi:hypothetical protein